ncbi:MAG: CDP-alcohol phosphatidyltransferase family protein [Chloroflexota bacterium]
MLATRLNNLRSRRPLMLAWGVHLFTATGAVWGLLAIIAAIAHDWQQAFIWMAAAVVVDGIDGTLARRFKVKGLTPSFDGALLDNIIDYQNYVLVPALILYEAALLPTGTAVVTVGVIGLAMVLLSSAYQFCQADAKTDDHTFKGFPSYWNIVVFYLFMLNLSPWVNFWVIFICAVLVFVPIKYIYPSRMVKYRRMTLVVTTLWGIVNIIILFNYPNYSTTLVWVSASYALYYVGLSLYMMFFDPDTK